MNDPVQIDGLARDSQTWTAPPDPIPAGGDRQLPPAPPDADLLARFMPERFAVVDRTRLAICRPDSSTWLSLDSRAPAVAGTLIVLIEQCRADAVRAGYAAPRNSSPTSLIRETVAALSRLVIRPAPGVLQVRQDDFDRAPVLPLRGGNAIDLRDGSIITPAQLPPYLVTDTGHDGIAYNPALLDKPPPAAAAVVQHFGDALLRRLARHLLGPDKVIDVVRLPETGRGKSTLANALAKGLPGQVAVRAAHESFTSQRMKFSEPATLLANFRLVIFDEADKLREPPPTGAMNALTDYLLSIEQKGQDVRGDIIRRGNALFLGADWPNLVAGQGSDSRFVWADDRLLPPLPAGLWGYLMSDAGAAYLATYMVTAAISISRRGDDTDTEESRDAARRMLARSSDPLVEALLDHFEPGEADDWCSISSIKEALREAGVTWSNDQALGRLLDAFAPESKRLSRRPEPGKAAVRGRRGIRRRDESEF